MNGWAGLSRLAAEQWTKLWWRLQCFLPGAASSRFPQRLAAAAGSGLCFLIHSAILCLLIGAFIAFTFKVIIDTYSLPFFPIFTFVPLSVLCLLHLNAAPLASPTMLV